MPSSDQNIDPLATEPLTEFYTYYLRYNAPDEPDFAERASAGNQLLQDVLATLAEPGANPPENANFDQVTLDFVDQNQAVLSPAELVTAACILQLDSPCA